MDVVTAKLKLRKKLLAADLRRLGVSEYNQRYIFAKLAQIDAILDLYGKILEAALYESQQRLAEFTLVDYGGGSGVLSLLAKEVGVGNVVYTDIYEVACEDVRLLSNGLGLALNHIVSGDIAQVLEYLKKHALSPDAFTSYDVLEHIYDLSHHFSLLAQIGTGKMKIVYGSAANTRNPRIVRFLAKKQHEAEFSTRVSSWGHKERDTLTAYYDLRREIIVSHSTALSLKEVETLASNTRGLIKADILSCVEEYLVSGKTNYRPKHPTNTCDPLTGNWCEQLIDFEWLLRSLSDLGFDARLEPGHYPKAGGFLKRAARISANCMIDALGRRGMVLAPYFLLIAEVRRKRPTSRPGEFAAKVFER